jgi:hypothetical protein
VNYETFNRKSRELQEAVKRGIMTETEMEMVFNKLLKSVYDDAKACVEERRPFTTPQIDKLIEGNFEIEHAIMRTHILLPLKGGDKAYKVEATDGDDGVYTLYEAPVTWEDINTNFPDEPEPTLGEWVEVAEGQSNDPLWRLIHHVFPEAK